MKIQICWQSWLTLIALATGLLVNQQSMKANDDFGSWHGLSVKFLDSDRWTLAAVGQARLRNDSSELFSYLLSPQLTYKVSPYLRLGMNYTYLPTRPAAGGDFRYQHRWETEINPRWPVNDWLTLDLRNRFELRWLEDRRGTNERSRHRPQATIRLKGLGPLESVFINNEFFYDYDAHLRSENRLVPLGMNIRLNSRTVFTTYYMLASVRGSGGWINTHVPGSQFTLDF